MKVQAAGSHNSWRQFLTMVWGLSWIVLTMLERAMSLCRLLLLLNWAEFLWIITSVWGPRGFLNVQLWTQFEEEICGSEVACEVSSRVWPFRHQSSRWGNTRILFLLCCAATTDMTFEKTPRTDDRLKGSTHRETTQRKILFKWPNDLDKSVKNTSSPQPKPITLIRICVPFIWRWPENIQLQLDCRVVFDWIHSNIQKAVSARTSLTL